MAFEVIDEWMANIRAHLEQTVDENQPPAAVDSCFDTGGALMASGEDVWDGVLDDEPAGACTERFAIHSSSDGSPAVPSGVACLSAPCSP